MSLDAVKGRVRGICSPYGDRIERTRRLYLEERAISLENDRGREFAIKTEISEYYGVPYSHVRFCGSAQLGFSIHKDKVFQPGISDLDTACIDTNLFQKAWIDVIETTKSFSDLTPFGTTRGSQIEIFEKQITRRGMIRVDAMPASKLKQAWTQFQGTMSRRHTTMFKSISLAIYLNEYAFCWKQDSSVSSFMR